MGGRLWLESAAGEGSTFHFTAQLRRDPNPMAAASAREASGSAQPLALRCVSVLVVDDNETHRRVLEKSLTGWGMRPTLVASGAQALAAMRQAAERGSPFPLVLLDAGMPEMDGFD